MANNPQVKLTVAYVTDNRELVVMYPGFDPNSKPVKPKNDMMEQLKSLKPGNIINIRGILVGGNPMLTTLSLYQLKPGEEEPYAFIFRSVATTRTGTTETTTVEVSKLARVMKLQLPPVKNKLGKIVPDPNLLTDVSQFRNGDMVLLDGKQVAGVLYVTEMHPYVPLQKGQLIKVFKKGERKESAEDKDFAFAEVQTAAGTEVIRLAADKNAAGQWVVDQDLVNSLSAMKPNEQIEFRLLTNRDGRWLTFARPAPEPKKDAKGATAPKEAS